MTIETLLNIISKFPTKQSRYRLRFILRDSSKDLVWRNEISDILYILYKLDSDEDKSEVEELQKNILEEELTSEPIQEPIPEPVQEPIQEPIPEQIQEPIQEILQEPIVPELTDIEKIQLQYEEKVRNILLNK
jgi:hypothetical protein